MMPGKGSGEIVDSGASQGLSGGLVKIKTSSWHYRLLSWAECPIPRSICGYFWAVVFMCLMGWWVWLFVVGICRVIDAISDHEPGPFGRWIKARKDKVCPIIEIEYDSD